MGIFTNKGSTKSINSEIRWSGRNHISLFWGANFLIPLEEISWKQLMNYIILSSFLLGKSELPPTCQSKLEMFYWLNFNFYMYMKVIKLQFFKHIS